ncbi:MAG: bifunctional glutamate N-acetyltransferase/amino-acid acetyltransferase ArgJ [Hyphomicrobiales bacterium]
MGTAHQRAPLAPERFPDLPPVGGVRLATAETGIRYKGRTDVMLALLAEGTTIAGCYTTSKTRSAPVDWCRDNTRRGLARAFVVNAGNSNAFTGKLGVKAVEATAKAAAATLDCDPEDVFIASTGVIGEPLDYGKIVAALPGLAAQARPDAWLEAASAIMTTDTFPKGATATAKIEGRTVTINGIAKGSGMIAPDMATMLVFLFTDANLPSRVLQALLSASVDRSFNAITVDGDTSTSDTVLLAATGAAGPRPKALKGAADPRLKAFAAALDSVTTSLAHQVVCDGEGAEKFIAVAVTGAESDAAARRIGLAIANSPLVKTAIAGEDANWGRIVMAVGKSGEAADRDRLKIAVGGVTVAKRGQRDPAYDEATVVPHMKGRHIDIAVDVGVGKGKATVWTCDLTHRYIDINGSYRS